MWKRFDPELRRAVTGALRRAALRGAGEASVEDLASAVINERAGGDQSPAHAPPAERQAGSTPRPAPAASAGFADHFDADALAALQAAARSAGRRRKVRIRDLHPFIRRALEVKGAAALLASLPPERRPGVAARIGRALADTAPAFVLRRVARAPKIAWGVYARKSLGHPDYVNNPYRVYRALRSRQPVRRDPLAPVWIVTSYAHTLAVLKDEESFEKDPFSSERLPRGARAQLGMSEGAGARSSAENISMLFLDPPEHTRVRSIFTRAFTPRTISALRPRIEEICRQRIAAMSEKGSGDLITELAYPLPVMVIAELLGSPREDYQKLKKWSDEMAEALGFVPSEGAKLKAARARDEMRGYFFDQIVPRLRRRPDGSLLSSLLMMEARGEGLNADELFSNSVLLLAAGHETTTNLIGNGVVALMRHREQWSLLCREPELLDSAVEELLRFDPPVQWITRVARRQMTLGGMTIRRGELVLAALGAANRDPTVFDDPDRLDIRRGDNRHLSFGSGIHFCLGAALARMEAQVAIGELARTFPEMRLASDRLRWRKGITFRGVESLPLVMRG